MIMAGEELQTFNMRSVSMSRVERFYKIKHFLFFIMMTKFYSINSISGFMAFTIYACGAYLTKPFFSVRTIF